MKRDEILQRARSAIGKGIVYGLGKGGYDPKKDTPASWSRLQGYCDCSGFIAWCFGVSRRLKGNPYYEDLNGGWFETSAIYKDAFSNFGFVDTISRLDCKIGDILVWPDHPPTQGHIGLVSEVETHSIIKVIHCSKSNYNHFRDAIQETDPKIFFDHEAICARIAWLED